MRRRWILATLLVGTLLPTGSAVAAPLAALAQDGEGATLIIHYRECAEVPADGDWYGACHDTPFPGATLGVVNEETTERTTATGDDAGNLTYTLPPGTYRLDGPPGHALDGQEFFCSASDTPASEIPLPMTLAAGDSVTCDLSIVQACYAADPAVCDDATDADPAPADDDGAVDGDGQSDEDSTADDGEDEAAPPADDGASGGAEEAGESDLVATVYAADCDDLGNAVGGGEPIGDPGDAAAEGAEVVGSADAILVTTAFFTSDTALDDMLGEDYVVAVLVAGVDEEAVIACGPVGGVRADDGSLAIGLRSEDASGTGGVVGVAYLAPADEDGQTLVTVFLTEEPADEDGGTPEAE